MELKIMKMDLYVLSVLQSKGLEVDTFLKMTDEELDNHDLPMKVTDHIKDMKTRSLQGTEEIKEVLNDAKEKVEDTVTEEIINEIASNYVTEEVKEVEQERGNTKEVQQVDEVGFIEEEKEVPETVTIERVISNPDALETLSTLLQSKELRTLASYTKLIKAEMSKEDLAKIDNAQMVSMIEERINEVKSK